MENVLRDAGVRVFAAECETDVVLCCHGDARRLKAHRVMLSAASPLLHKLLLDQVASNEKSTLIFSDIKYEILSSVVEYIYSGSVNLPLALLSSFFETCNAIKIKISANFEQINNSASSLIPEDVKERIELAVNNYSKLKYENKYETNIENKYESDKIEHHYSLQCCEVNNLSVLNRNSDNLIKTKPPKSTLSQDKLTKRDSESVVCANFEHLNVSRNEYHSNNNISATNLTKQDSYSIKEKQMDSCNGYHFSSLDNFVQLNNRPHTNFEQKRIPDLVPLKKCESNVKKCQFNKVSPSPWTPRCLPLESNPRILYKRNANPRLALEFEKPFVENRPISRAESFESYCSNDSNNNNCVSETNQKIGYSAPLLGDKIVPVHQNGEFNSVKPKSYIRKPSTTEISETVKPVTEQNRVETAEKTNDTFLQKENDLIINGVTTKHSTEISKLRKFKFKTFYREKNKKENGHCDEIIPKVRRLTEDSENVNKLVESSLPVEGNAIPNEPNSVELQSTGQDVDCDSNQSSTFPDEETKQCNSDNKCGSFICGTCSAKFEEKQLLKDHAQCHVGEKPYFCDECGKTFSQLRNFKYHRSVHEGTKEFAAECPECGKHFNDRGYLSSHLKIHRNRKEYKCPHCPKSFNQRVAYNMHVRIHTGVKPHECSTCGKSFSRKMLLKQHQRVHTGERPYRCVTCGKAFADRSNMSLHARLHTGVKPYSCTVCDKSFTKKHHLKTHMNYHSGARPYACAKCGATFSQSSNMRTHYKKCTGRDSTVTVASCDSNDAV